MADLQGGGLRFAPAVTAEAGAMEKPKPIKPARTKKNDPKLAAAARELRDRWLEELNAGRYVLEERGKYTLSPAGDERSRIVLGGEGRVRGEGAKLVSPVALALPPAA